LLIIYSALCERELCFCVHVWTLFAPGMGGNTKSFGPLVGAGGLGITTGGASLRLSMLSSVRRDSSSVAWNLMYAAMRFCSSTSRRWRACPRTS
jgi:hypothetical protein